MTDKTKIADPLINPSNEFFDNPYPALKRVREEAPVLWSEKGEYWLVTRYADIREILSDLHFEKGARKLKSLDMFAKLIPATEKMASSRGKSMLNANPPDHTRLRGLVNKAFTPNMVHELKPRVEKITNELLDQVQSKGQMDLIDDFAFPLPSTVIAEMLGIPVKDRDKFKHWSHTITTLLDPNPNVNVINLAKVMHAYSELNHFLEPLIEERRKEKRDDLISKLVEAEEEGSKLTSDELLANIVLLLIAGHETTTNLIGNGTLAFLMHPEQLELLKSKPELMSSAVQECLRYDSPVQMVRRIAAEELEVHGVKVQPEQALILSIGAANRDPEQFPDPDKFDITRNPTKHLAFGHGIHHCLGSSLAEMEGAVAFTALFNRMPNLKLATQKWEFKHPYSLRGLKELPVKF